MSEHTSRLTTALADRYRIERELGSGGMATVYLAADLRHDRKVAVKVLRPELAAVLGAERFLQEIKVTANLQHPHILQLYDSGEADTHLYYVMPYIEGETLRRRLAREKQLSVDESLAITRAVASALDYAHRHGVIHRDIKPENILLHDGQPVVADFGISLAVSAAGGTRITETGLSLGTPHYMSPEQATADRALDARSDVYSLACVTYEMLAGEPPHTGASIQAILAKIITDDPAPITSQRESVPRHVEEALRSALAKLPADRFSSAAEFASALDDPGFRSPVSADGAGMARESRDSSDRRVYVAWGTTVAVAAAAIGWAALRPLPPRPMLTLSVALPEGEQLAEPWLGPAIALSADGSTLAYTGMHEGPTWQLWVRRRDERSATPVRGTASATNLALSPDGSEVAFATGRPGPLVVVRIVDGVSRSVADSAVWGALDWGDDGALYYLDAQGGISRVPGSGGSSTQVVDPRPARDLREIDVLPGSHGAVLTVQPGTPTGLSEQEIAAVRFDTGEMTPLVAGTRARYAPPDRLLWTTDAGELLSAPFDVARLRITGPPVAVLQDVHRGQYGSADFAVSETGTLVYRTGQIGTILQPVWVSRDGTWNPVTPDWYTAAASLGSLGIAVSPEGSRLALTMDDNGTVDVWVKELPRGAFARLTFSGQGARPSWHPDGASVLYHAPPRGIGSDRVLLRKRADGSTNAEVMVEEDRAIDEADLSSDGAWVVYRLGQGTRRDLYAMELGRDGVGRPLLDGDYDEKSPALAPNDRWLAYVSDESGREEVYVRPFPDVDATRWQISTDGGTAPVWARSGEELFYRNGDGDVVAVGVATDPTFAVVDRTVLFSSDGFVTDPNHAIYDVAPDGRFAMFRHVRVDRGELIWVENWTGEPLLAN